MAVYCREMECVIPECDRPHYSRGLCKLHYARAKLAASPPCVVDGCEKPAKSKGMCSAHVARLRKHGDPSIVLPVPEHTKFQPGHKIHLGKTGQLSGHWVGDDVGRLGAHDRVRAKRGPARDHLCAHCGGPARDWAYDHMCPRERIDPVKGSAYSPDPERYMPLCRLCHRTFDKARRDARGRRLEGMRSSLPTSI